MVVQHNLRAMNSNRMLGITQGSIYIDAKGAVFATTPFFEEITHLCPLVLYN